METEFEQFHRIRLEAANREYSFRDIALQLRDAAGWDPWAAIRAARLMAPAEASFTAMVDEIDQRFPPKPSAYRRYLGPLLKFSIPVSAGGLVGVSLAQLLLGLLSTLDETHGHQD